MKAGKEEGNARGKTVYCMSMIGVPVADGLR